MPLIDEFIQKLKEASTVEDFKVVEAMYREHADELPYSKKMLEAVHDKDPALGLACLIRLYTVDVRDSNLKTDYEHLIQTIVRMNWVEGLKYVLQEKPSLIDIPIFWIYTEKQSKPEVHIEGTLLKFAIKNECKTDIVKILMNAKPNLALTASTGYNIVHEFAAGYNLPEELSAAENSENDFILDWILNNASLEVLNAESISGSTPYEFAAGRSNTKFMDKFKAIVVARFGQETMDRIIAETLDRVSVSRWAAPEFFTKSEKEKEKYFEYNFGPPLPKYDPVMLLSALIGKNLARQKKEGHPMNARVFASHEQLCDYLVKLCNQEKEDFIVNAILFVPEGRASGAHSVNLFCIKTDAGIQAILIDGTGDTTKYCATLESDLATLLDASKIHFESIHSKTRIQYNKMTGCQIISAYLSGKLSRLSVEEAKTLYSTLKEKSEDDAVHLRDFPLWLGMLGITQSMKAIEQEKAKIPVEELNKPVNRVGEIFEQRLARGKGQEFCPGYTSLTNKIINSTLVQKKEHQGRHALGVIALSNDELVEAMATVLGLKVTSPDWKKEMSAIIPEMKRWGLIADRKPMGKNK